MKLKHISENVNDRMNILVSLGYQQSNAIPGYMVSAISPPISEREITSMSQDEWNRFVRDVNMHINRHKASIQRTAPTTPTA